MKKYYVYIMSNKAHRMYIGVTSTLEERVFQHKNKVLEGFTSRYNFDRFEWGQPYKASEKILRLLKWAQNDSPKG